MIVDESLIQKAANYRPDEAALDAIRHVPLLFAAGITAAGKDTVLNRLVDENPHKFQFLVSYTTRLPRKNDGVLERSGVEYHFIDSPTAKHMIDEGKFVEVNYFAGNIYGTGIAEIAAAQTAHKISVKDVEVQGIGDYMRLGMNLKPVFLLPPSFDIWWKRLTTRYRYDLKVDNLDRRLSTARRELQYALDHDFFYLVINDDLETTVQDIIKIAEDQQTERRPVQAIDLIHQIIQGIDTQIPEKRIGSDKF